MKITVLVDNNTYIDKYYFGEPALSIFIEDNDKNILFDVGYSEIYGINAEKIGIDLKKTDTIVISHGHNDHTLGLKYIDKYLDKGYLKKIKMVAAKETFSKKRLENDDIGSPLSKEDIINSFDAILTDEPLKISDNIFFLGKIPRTTDFEEKTYIGERYSDGEWIKDDISDDTALAYKSEKGIFIITGCSHSGICNICEHAKKVLGCEKIFGIIGGFHLFEDNNRLSKTIKYLKSLNLEYLLPCHCTSFKAKSKINESISIEEVAVGFTLKTV